MGLHRVGGKGDAEEGQDGPIVTPASCRDEVADVVGLF